MHTTYKHSRVDKIIFRGISFYLKRDDLIDRDFSGNKARKLHHFLTNEYSNIKRVISHGSNQSNAMYSLSVLAKRRGWEFIYYTKHLSSYLRENPEGNYKEALKNGMKLIVDEEFTKEKFSNLPQDTLFISEGAAVKEAEEGIELLAKEINMEFEGREVEIFLPSGTGATALFLQKHTDFRVYTTPCVGDREYLLKQFIELSSDSTTFPTIIDTNKKYHFGKLQRELYEIWHELKSSTDIEFDLLYDPVGWLAIFENLELFKSPILYIHQGGLLGNETMLKRYRRRGMDETI